MESNEPLSAGELFAHECMQKVVNNIELVIKDKREVIERTVEAIAAKGHVLLEDVPGTGKTVMARALAKSIDGKFERIQFTPDLYPRDITGGMRLNQETRELYDVPGPVRLGNIVLCDEINRALEMTQAALLEIMGEGQVTVDGVTYAAKKPFFVIATQNPIDQGGTQPLPEAQMDRFMIQDTFGHPNIDATMVIMKAQKHGHPIDTINPVISIDDLRRIRLAVQEVKIKDTLLYWISLIADKTRALSERGEKPMLYVGPSTRGAIALDRMSRAAALMAGRSYVIPEDIEELLVPVLGHRLIIRDTTLSKRVEMNRAGAISSFFKDNVLQDASYEKVLEKMAYLDER